MRDLDNWTSRQKDSGMNLDKLQTFGVPKANKSIKVVEIKKNKLSKDNYNTLYIDENIEDR